MSEETDMAAPLTRGEMNAGFERLMRRFDELGAEMRSLVKASEEVLKKHIDTCLDPYRDAPDRLKNLERHELPERVDQLDEAQLPQRVERLENHAWPPKPPLETKNQD